MEISMVAVKDVIYCRTDTALCSYDVKSETWKDLENTEPKDMRLPRPGEDISVDGDGHYIVRSKGMVQKFNQKGEKVLTLKATIPGSVDVDAWCLLTLPSASIPGKVSYLLVHNSQLLYSSGLKPIFR